MPKPIDPVLEKLIAQSEGRCFACSKYSISLELHDRGRGAVCPGCAKGLAGFKDSIDILLGAVNYLTRTRSP